MTKLAQLSFLFFIFQCNLACSQSSDSAFPGNSTARKSETKTETENPTILDSSSNPPLQLMPTFSGRAMAFKYSPGSEGPVWILIHGLADDMAKLDKLAELAREQKISVLQVDLQGHGETLKSYLKTHAQLPGALDYQDNVADIQEILRKLQVKDVAIIGHSYGGAIAFALAQELNKSGIAKVHTLHMLAPYVQRIDQFLRESYLPQNPLFPMGSNLNGFSDTWMDPLLAKYVDKSYRDYIVENSYGTAQLSQAQEKEVEFKVQAAILSTKGIRKFDLLDPRRQVPEVGANLQVLGGESDTLVLPRQLQAFDQRLSESYRKHQLQFLKGEKATHLFPRLLPQETLRLILQFATSPSGGG